MPETPVICIEIIKGLISLIIAYRVFHWGKQAFKENTLLKIAVDSYLDAIKGLANCNVELHKAHNLYYRKIRKESSRPERKDFKELDIRRKELVDKTNDAQKNKDSSSPVLSLFNPDLISKEEGLINCYSNFIDIADKYFFKQISETEFEAQNEIITKNFKMESQDLQTLINNEYAATIHGKKTFSKESWLDRQIRSILNYFKTQMRMGSFYFDSTQSHS